MKTRKQRCILLVAEWADPRFQRGVARYAVEAGWHLNLDCVYSRDLPWGWEGDGCIAMAGRPEIAEFTQSLRIPVIDVTHQQEGVGPRVHEDDGAIGELAADYLLGLGFRHFACYRTDSLDVSKVRHDSFAAKVAVAGCCAKELMWNRYGEKKPDKWAKRERWLIPELQKLPKPAAVFCIDDRMAVNVIEACKSSGVQIPDEVAVLGVGNLEIACECAAVPLSSVRIDFAAMGYRAAEVLDRVLNGETPPPVPVLLPPQGIEERRSTYTLAVEDPAGRKAVRFMLDHLSSPIGIRDVTQVAGLTRRQLTYVTQKELGIAPARLLEDIRIRKARELLRTTNFTVHRVACETGLGTALRLQRIFRRRFNTSPGAWRRLHRANA